jgi:hypothetical protein
VLAGVDELVRHLDRLARGRLRKRDPDLHGEVAPLDPPGAAAAAECAAERVAAEERVEDVRKRAEAVRLRREPPRVEALEAVAVVRAAPLRVRQDLVRLSGFLELLLGLGVVAVHVGVQLARDPAEGLLDLRVLGVARDAEDLVRVAPHSS